MPLPIHPLLFALYPILALLASNGDQVGAQAALRPALMAAALALALPVALRLPARDWHRAAALTSLSLVAFFSYGHVYDLLKPVEVMGQLVGRHRFLVPAFFMLGAACAWGVVRNRRPHEMSRMLNLVGLALVGMPLLTVGARVVGEGVSSRPSAATGPTQLVRPPMMPDIYYIVLDAYTREDVLRRDFGVDNRPFLAELERLGFEVARCAQSNYAQTELTLATTLNLDYLDQLGKFPASGRDRTPLLFLIRDSAVRRGLESLGYTVVAFETGYAWSEWQDADVYLRPEDQAGLRIPLTPFELLLFDSTALTIVSDARTVLPPALGGFLDGPLELHRRRVLFALDELGGLAEMEGPKFVFAHVVAPHRPYLFAPDPGSVRAEDSLLAGVAPAQADGYVIGYRNQVLYLNDRILPVLERIVWDSAVPPIVILHGDHGPDDAGPPERMAILHAVRLPGAESPLPVQASPVNTFRRVLSAAFDAGLAPLADRSYFSGYDAPFDLQQVPNDCRFQ